MAPIEAFFSSPSFEEKITVKKDEHRRFHLHDINVDLKGESNGGTAIIRRHSQTKSVEINLKQGQTQEKSYSVVAKGGIIEQIKLKITGK